MKHILFILFLVTTLNNTLTAQTLIRGIVSDHSGETIPGANIHIKGTYEGTSSGIDGRFSVTTMLKGEQILVISFLGFQTKEKPILLSDSLLTMHITLKPGKNELGGVEITAGAFEASDEKKAVILKPLDIVTTAGSNGDITGALNSLPGTMTVGEEGKLYVRGGDSHEVRTYIDGLPVKHAYSSSMPDLPSRSLFSPYLFSGTVFSTGGYSAEYGQALSSALILNSNDLPENTVSGISLMSIGAGGSHTHKWDNTSLSASLEYYNLAPYYALVPQDITWEKTPEGISGNAVFRHAAGKNGMLKSFANFSSSYSRLLYPDPADLNNNMIIGLKNRNLLLQTTYRDILNDKWISHSGILYENRNDETEPGTDLVIEKEKVLHARHSVTCLTGDIFKLKGGIGITINNFNQDYNDNIENKTFSTSFHDRLFSGFLETELKLGNRFASRVGGRYEYSGLLKRANIAPRVSLAYKTGKHSQISCAFGSFYQTPDKDYLRFNHSLEFEKATHYIINYQIMKNRRIFRAEAYYKLYGDLVKYHTLHNADPLTYNNNGHGYAQGIDVFFRDRKTFSNGDYWISYSFIDTKRDYRNYPKSATPSFVSNHNLNIVFKYWIEKISSQIGGTYKMASGRTFYNPNSEKFLDEKTKVNHDLSLNISYLTEIFKQFTIIHLSVTNVPGFDQVFNYRYQETPDEKGIYPSLAVRPASKRFLFLGIFISL